MQPWCDAFGSTLAFSTEMNFTSNMNDTFQGPTISPSPAIAGLLMTQTQSPITIGITTLLASLISFLAYQIYRPSVHPKSPKFTSDTYPILGSIGFVLRPWSFWKNSVKESKTGNFSFWQGKNHVVGISGPAAKKLILEHPSLNFVAAQSLLAFGLDFGPPNHDIFISQGNGSRERNSSYFLRTLLALMKTPRLERVLPGLVQDASTDFKALLPNNPSGVVNSPKLWHTVFKQGSRLFFADDLAEDPVLFKKTSETLEVALHAYSPFYAFCHWIPEPSAIRRKLTRWRLRNTAEKLYNQRIKSGSTHKNDALQVMINNGDAKESILEFCASGAFITTTNAHIIAPQLITAMAIHPEWQEKCYQEIVAAADVHSTDKDAPLVDRLSSLPLRAWESSFPSMEMCLNEIIRVWTSFGVGRLNKSPEPIPIPGTDEVIPPNTYVVYDTTESNFNPKLYPKPNEFDPLRFTEGREEFKQEAHGFFGWGSGNHPCAGKRWGKLQQYILLAHALALYKWTSCDVNGEPDLYAAQRQDLSKDLDSDTKFALPPAYCKITPREQVQA